MHLLDKHREREREIVIILQTEMQIESRLESVKSCLVRNKENDAFRSIEKRQINLYNAMLTQAVRIHVYIYRFFI